jgi:hypothetical protein
MTKKKASARSSARPANRRRPTKSVVAVAANPVDPVARVVAKVLAATVRVRPMASRVRRAHRVRHAPKARLSSPWRPQPHRRRILPKWRVPRLPRCRKASAVRTEACVRTEAGRRERGFPDAARTQDPLAGVRRLSRIAAREEKKPGMSRLLLLCGGIASVLIGPA